MATVSEGPGFRLHRRATLPAMLHCATFEKFPFGNSPTAAVVQLEKDLPAILFSAETGGVTSGCQSI